MRVLPGSSPVGAPHNESPFLLRRVIAGCRVMLSGLVSKPELNGLLGVVLADVRPKTGRFPVRLDEGQGHSRGPYEFKPGNLALAPLER